MVKLIQAIIRPLLFFTTSSKPVSFIRRSLSSVSTESTFSKSFPATSSSASASSSSSLMSQYSTLLIEPDEAGIRTAASLLIAGELVAFPTETVYGLGANALNAEAVKSIFIAKGRPLTDPLIVHVSTPQDVTPLIDLTPLEQSVFTMLADTFWPGPLTLIVKASSAIPPLVTAQTGFVGVRCPAHPLASRLLAACRLPIAAPSANRFGHVSPTKALHVLADLGVKGVRVLNGESSSSHSNTGESAAAAAATATTTTITTTPAGSFPATCEYGIESTVAKINGDTKIITIFRPGAVSEQRIARLLAGTAATADWRVVSLQRAVQMHGTEDKRKDDDSGGGGNSNNNSGEASADAAAAAAAATADSHGECAPGQAVTHYAPACPCHIVRRIEADSNSNSSSSSTKEGGEEQQQQHLVMSTAELQNGTVVIDFGSSLLSLTNNNISSGSGGGRGGGVLAYKDLSPSGNFAEAAQSLFDTLRWAEDVPNVSTVLIADVFLRKEAAAADADADAAIEQDEKELMFGVADRIFRSASGSYVTLKVIVN